MRKANTSDIKEGAKFTTINGRKGIAYAVSQKNIDNETVNLQFDDGPFCVVSGVNYKPSHGLYRLEVLFVEE